jgi:SAM-dependent methyltransferase
LDLRNTYADPAYAAAYAKLGFPGTYALAFRDLPGILAEHVSGRRALDFGCGTGRSARYLRECGFHVVGVDIADVMLREARSLDPAGDYRLVKDGDFAPLARESFDLVLSAFTFDNVATMTKKIELLAGLRALLAPHGRIVMVVSSPEMYTHGWVSFSTRAFPENRRAHSGDTVRIVNLAIADRTPCEDVLWTDDAYQETFRRAGLAPAGAYHPLASAGDPGEWVNETSIAPWVIYVLKAA